jgi:phosphatidylserine/phosphatidylglycerophosphate/cardiolipin synthase-like enzyme
MKRILLLSLCSIQMMYGMFARVPLSMQRTVNQRPYNTTNTNFGKKHFIIGYSQTQQNIQPTTSPVQKDKVPSTVSYFTSVHDVRKELDEHLKKAQQKICIATFALTDAKIADLLINAQQKSIEIIIVTDRENMKNKHSKIDRLAQNNIAIHYYNPTLNTNPRQKKAKDALMHHKFIIIDDALLIFGSLNLTKSGQENNMENITVTTKSQIVKDYQEEFQRLLTFSTKV